MSANFLISLRPPSYSIPCWWRFGGIGGTASVDVRSIPTSNLPFL